MLFFVSLLVLFLSKGGDALSGTLINSEANVRLAFCRILERCGTTGEIQAYAGAYPLSDARTNELVRSLAQLADFEQKFITDNPNAIDNIYLKILGRTPCSDAKYIGQRVIQSNGYRYLVNQLIDSPEYKEKFGTSLVPGNGTCPQSFC